MAVPVTTGRRAGEARLKWAGVLGRKPPVPGSAANGHRTPPPKPRQAPKRLVKMPALGLRARVTATFAFGALVVSGVLSAVIFITSRGLIIDQQVSLLSSQAIANATLIDQTLTPNTQIIQMLGSVKSVDSESVLYYGKYWYGTYFAGGTKTADVAETRLPASLVALVLAGRPAQETFTVKGSAQFVIGIPINGVKAYYFEDFALSSVQSTLHRLLIALASAALAATLAGAVFGRWSAARALRPLRDVAAAASAIAGGELGTRLETEDASELAVLANSFNQMVDRLQERIERDARFNADVSHELRSPLTTLAASIAVLESRASELPQRSQLAVSLASAEVRRFQRMVSDLLEISRLDAGSIDLALEEVQVGELVRRTAETAVRDLRLHGLMQDASSVERQGRRGDLGFAMAIDDEVGERHVLVDKRRFERIIANLVENASLYGDGVTKVSVEGDESLVRIAVEDAGPGVPPDERERVFERFSRGTTGGRRGSGQGTGLGLALVAEHTRLHGGRAWVEESEAQGARFVVELPLIAPDPESEEVG
jgi:two-component system, OmpR family, sensor histidine kinase MtrB